MNACLLFIRFFCLTCPDCLCFPRMCNEKLLIFCPSSCKDPHCTTSTQKFRNSQSLRNPVMRRPPCWNLATERRRDTGKKNIILVPRTTSCENQQPLAAAGEIPKNLRAAGKRFFFFFNLEISEIQNTVAKVSECRATYLHQLMSS